MTLGTINLISVPVTDQDRAKQFYVDTLGFTVKYDYVMDEGNRWVMLTPPGGGAEITLATWFDDLGPSKMSISCADADAVRATLVDRGVAATEVQDAFWGRHFMFDDPDGNNWLVVAEPRA